MHAWAGMEHKLAYKSQRDVPREFRRSLSQLSALLEIADERFDNLKHQKEDYRLSVTELVKEPGGISASQSMNLDSLQAFMDVAFPDRKQDVDIGSELLSELNESGVTFADIRDGLIRCKDVLKLIEEESFGEQFSDSYRWTQAGILRTVLKLTHDRYWSGNQKKLMSVSDPTFKSMIDKHLHIVEKWRAKLNADSTAN
jgi:hypothetical protein